MSHQRHLRGRSLRSTNWIEDTRGELALQQLGVPVRAARALYAAGYRTREDIASSPDAELLLVPGVGPARLAATRAAVPYDPTMVTLWDTGGVITALPAGGPAPADALLVPGRKVRKEQA